MNEKRAACVWQSPSLYIGDLDLSVREDDLAEIFSQFGAIDSIKVCKNWTTGAPLGYGFINYHEINSAERALQSYNYCPIKGKPCRLMWSTKRSIGSSREDEAANVYVKGLPKSMTNRGLHELFSRCGVVLSAKVATSSVGSSLGYGYVSFTKQSYANRALRDLHKTKLGHMTISVEPFVEKKKRYPSKASCRVYVQGLPLNWTEENVLSRFSVYGQVQKVVLSRDIYGISQGCAFVAFADYKSAKVAVRDCNNHQGSKLKPLDSFLGVPLKVSFDTSNGMATRKGQALRRPGSRASFGSGSEDQSTSVDSEFNFQFDIETDLLGWNAFEQKYGQYKLRGAGLGAGSLFEVDGLLSNSKIGDCEENVFEFIEGNLER